MGEVAAINFEEWDNPFEKMVLNEGYCFLCGGALRNTETEEHIFPRWLLHRHSLWDQKVNLLNKSSIPYRQLTVPCCEECNNEDLSQVEGTVSAAFLGGYEAVLELDELVLFQWTGRMFFALLYREMALLLDQADPTQGSIMSPEYLSQLDVLHGLLQSVYRPVEFISDPPFSVLVANLHELETPDDFNFHDDLFQMTFSLRSNDVGVIVAFEDGRINAESYGRYLDDVGGHKLHPIQFDELFAKVTYNVRRLNYAPKYTFAIPEGSDEPFQVAMLPLGGYSGKPIVADWDAAEYVPILAAVWSKWGIQPESLYEPPDRVRSYMKDEDGDLLLLDLDCTGSQRC